MSATRFYRSLMNPDTSFNSSENSTFDKFFEFINDDSYRVESKESGWVLSLALPGVTKKETEISVDGNKLIIDVDSENGWVKKSRKKFSLPQSADSESIFAEMRDGILSVTITTRSEQKSKIIKIN
jgi:HSP20 family protein